jgi:hypothetical protein
VSSCPESSLSGFVKKPAPPGGRGEQRSAQETARECGFLAREGLRRSLNTAVFPGLREQFGAEQAISKLEIRNASAGNDGDPPGEERGAKRG